MEIKFRQKKEKLVKSAVEKLFDKEERDRQGFLRKGNPRTVSDFLIKKFQISKAFLSLTSCVMCNVLLCMFMFVKTMIYEESFSAIFQS